ncbi:MAG TPA: MFS transporter, partial [Candidatus Limnocylindrales bacterium]|nr:MFS transporter [Candidatus Limnocylindrales bacterium]
MNGRRRERLLTPLMLGVASGSILVPLNSTMLAVALPGVMDEFGLGAAAVSSLVSLYLGAVAVALPLSGAIGDRYGHRRAFLVGVTAFGAASLVAVAADTFTLLQLARVGQAASGALVSTTSAVLIREAAPADRRGEAFGLFDLLVSTSAAAGPFVGGLLVGTFGWRSLFVVAVPVAAVAAVTVGLWLRPRPATEGAPGIQPRLRATRPLDPLGLLLIAAVVVAAVVAMRPGEPPLQGLAALAIVPLLFLFVSVELRAPQPAVDPRLFLARPFSAAIAGQFGSTVILHASFLVVPLLVERLLRASPTTSGLVLLGIFGVAAVAAPWGGRISDRRGRRRPAVVGSLVMAAALAVLALPPATSDPLTISILLSVLGLGMGLAGAPRQAAAFETVRADRVGMAAGTYYTGRYLGGVVGASLGGALLASGV